MTAAAPRTAAPLRDILAACLDRRMPRIALLGFISGFPWVLIGSSLTQWLHESGFSRTSIGLFGLIFVVYAFNALWAPLVDRVRLPYLSRRLGARKAWIVLMQAVIFAAACAMALLTPAGHLWGVAFTGLVIAIASATQDVAIDALRIELVAESEQRQIAAGAAMTSAGWWAGFGVGGALALYLAEFYQVLGSDYAWQWVYLSLTVVVVLCVVLLVVTVSEPDATARFDAQRREQHEVWGDGGPGAWLVATWAMPVMRFMRRHGLRIGLALLLFVLLFKIGEAFLGRMSLVFYNEVGFDKTQIATYSKLIGSFTICAFSIIGGVINVRYGLFRGLLVSGVAMASTNLLFAALALAGPVVWLFAGAVVVDQFTSAVATVAFVAFLSQLCDRTWTATQYAALASLGNLSRTSLAAASGWLVDGLGGDWSLFFVITALMVAPSLVLLFGIRRPLAGSLRLDSG